MKHKKVQDTLSKEFLEISIKTKQISQIAKETGISRCTIRKYLRNLGIIQETLDEKYNRLLKNNSGRLKFLKLLNNSKKIGTIGLFICVCGKKKSISVHNVLKGKVQSCGCLHTEKLRVKGYQDISFAYYNGIKQNAQERGLDFTITMQDIL